MYVLYVHVPVCTLLTTKDFRPKIRDQWAETTGYIKDNQSRFKHCIKPDLKCCRKLQKLYILFELVEKKLVLKSLKQIKTDVKPVCTLILNQIWKLV